MSDFDSMPHEPEPEPELEPEPSLFSVPELPPAQASPASSETLELFQYWSQPEPVEPVRIPHLGHLCLLAALLVLGWLGSMAAVGIGLHFHLEGVGTLAEVQTNIHYLLGSEAVLYLVTFAGCLVLFPLLWKKSFLAGIQWHAEMALALGWKLPATALACIALAGIDALLLPGPANAPIDDIFRAPGAAWLMFAFGVTFAPFFEEMAFRGFLLPALATACDWLDEQFRHTFPRPLDANGHPQWSIPAMVIASIVTSLPFALLHGYQTGYALGPFLLLVVVSLVLCAVRLGTRSLAASVAVHACYNFLLFSFMLIGTDGFRHLGNM